MSGYHNLPRGTGREGENPLATGRWARPEEIGELAYAPGDLYLGTLPVPSPEAARQIEHLRERQAAIALDTRRDGDLRRAEIDGIEEEILALLESDEMEIGIDDDRHHLLVAGNRAGKTRTILTPNLLRYPGSVVATDPKGELARATAGIRAADPTEGGLGQTCLVMDPYSVSGAAPEMQATFNPLDLIREDDPRAIDVAAGIAEAQKMRTNPENVHFDDSSQIFIKGVILFVADVHKRKATRNLGTVHDYIARGAVLELARDKGGPPAEDDPSPFEYLLHLMRRSEAFDGAVAAGAESLLGMGSRERGSVLSTAKRSLEFLERAPMRRLFASSSFDLDALKTDPNGVTLYLCLPPQRMHDCGRFLRLMFSLLLERIYEIEAPPATGHPVLAVLEEFAVLGHMPLIEQAAGYAAGFGLKLLIVLQDLAQLQRHYKEGWETYIANAGCIQAFANNDVTTLEYLSKKLGECMVSQSTHNISTAQASSTSDPSAHSHLQGLMALRGEAAILSGPLGLLADHSSTGTSASTTESWNAQQIRTPLLLSDELQRVLAREEGNQLVLIPGRFPMLMRRST